MANNDKSTWGEEILMKTLDFTENDLKLNREGKLSQKQAKSQHRQSLGRLIFTSILSTPIFAMAPYVWFEFVDDTLMKPFLIAIPILVGFTVFADGFSNYLGTIGYVWSQKVEHEKGHVEVDDPDFSDWHRRYIIKGLVANKKRFRLKQSKRRAVEKYLHREKCIIYYLPAGLENRILSVEVLSK